MGGKHWSAEEEAYFWNTIIPKSPKRQGIRRNDPEMSWEELAAEMNTFFDGPERRRVYTAQGIFEHWFLNIQKGGVSKNARRFVDPYVAQMLLDGATRTGRGFAAKQGPRAPRRKTPAKETTAQKKARLRPAQSNTFGPLSDDANEEAVEAATSNTPGAVGNSSALNLSVGHDEDAEEDEDALFVGDGIPIESWDPTPTSNPTVSHNLTAPVSQNLYSSTTGSVGTNNARPQSLAALVLANYIARSTAHVDSAASTTAITPAHHSAAPTTAIAPVHHSAASTTAIAPVHHSAASTTAATPVTAITPVHHSTSSSHVSQVAQLMSDSARQAWDYCHRPSDPWNSQHATYTDGPTEYLQGAPSRVAQTAQPFPSHTTDRSDNSTAGIWDYETMGFNSVPSNHQLGGEVSSGTSQQGVSFGAPGMSNTSSSIFGGNQSGHGQHGYGERGYGQHNYGQREYGQREHGQHEHGQHEREHGQRNNGQREHGELQSGPENSLGFDLRNPLGGLVSGSGMGTYYGAYRSGFSTYGHENTSMTGPSDQPIPPSSGSHNHRDAFSGTAATAEQTPAVFPTASTNNATGAWGIGLPPFRNDNNQN